MKAVIPPQSLGSDNHAGVHPRIMQAIVDANQGHASAYGTDDLTQAAQRLLREHFGDVDAHFVFNGTAANVLGLRAMVPSYASVLCPRTAHIHVDECAAPEAHIGCKVQPLPSHDGKVHPEDVLPFLVRAGDQHHAGPRAISISQPTELGTLYSLEELRALGALAREHKLLLHMDGARLVNAAAALGVGLRTITGDAGVDVLSFGGTKNGLLFGEAVVFFNRALARDFAFIRKQGMQLASKMRFVAAQFTALLQDDLWLHNARHANAMAAYLAGKLQGVRGVMVTRPVQTNAVFATLPRAWVKRLREQSFFYIWNEQTFEARLMTSFDTTSQSLDAFCDVVRHLEAQE